MILREIKSICSPKGELGGIPFIINYIILVLLSVIFNYLGFLLTIEAAEYRNIPAFQFLTVLFLLITISIMIFVIFNYKRRFLNITKNLPISIILGIIFGCAVEIIMAFFYFNPILFLVNKIALPIIVATIPSKDADKKEYWNTYFSRVKNFFKNPITIFVIVMTIIDVSLVQYSVFNNKRISQIVPDEKMEKLVINPLSAYSGKTKEDILNIRKEFVKTSIFASENYTPNEEVFGQIEDKKPWWGMDYMLCSDSSIPKSRIGTGLSEESRYVNNPNILVGVQMSMIYSNDKKQITDFCNDKSLLFIPTELNYDKKNKLIIAKYKSSENLLKSFNKKRVPFNFVGLNARDFGYNWVYVNNNENTFFLPYSLDEKTITKEPKQFKTFIHVGNACKVDGGCNNASPFQKELEFKFQKLPAQITLSLWKNRPLFKNQPADMYVKMIFE